MVKVGKLLFFVTDEDSVLSLGISDSDFPLNKHPGKCSQSTGYVSRDGKMYCNEKATGNIEGERFNEGTFTISLAFKYLDNYDFFWPVNWEKIRKSDYLILLWLNVFFLIINKR